MSACDTNIDPLAGERDRYWDEVLAKYPEGMLGPGLDWYCLYRNQKIDVLELCFVLGAKMTVEEFHAMIWGEDLPNPCAGVPA